MYNSIEEIPEDRYLETLLNQFEDEDMDELPDDDEDKDEELGDDGEPY